MSGESNHHQSEETQRAEVQPAALSGISDAPTALEAAGDFSLWSVAVQRWLEEGYNNQNLSQQSTLCFSQGGQVCSQDSQKTQPYPDGCGDDSQRTMPVDLERGDPSSQETVVVDMAPDQSTTRLFTLK